MWQSFLTSRAKALAGDATGQGAGLLVARDCAYGSDDNVSISVLWSLVVVV